MLAVAGFRTNNSTTIKGLNAYVMNNIMDKLHICLYLLHQISIWSLLPIVSIWSLPFQLCQFSP